MYDLSKLGSGSSPHMRAEDDTRSLMFDVVLALMPALVVAVFTFGFRALVMTCTAVLSCVVFELLWCLITRKRATIGDFSAVVTGVLLAFNLPVAAPLWLAVAGSAFAVLVLKMLFGGIGKNVINPALGGRIFLLLAFAPLMTTWAQPHQSLPLFANVDATKISTATQVAGATPLAALKAGTSSGESLLDLFFGQHGGTIGETCAFALLLGGLYLLVRKVITLRIPAAYLLTVAALTLLFPLGDASGIQWMLSQVLSGGLLLGAIFMATDYTTSPATPKGEIIFGIGCGLLTVLLRYFSPMAEGASYAIVVMNLAALLIDRFIMPRRFGLAQVTHQAAPAAETANTLDEASHDAEALADSEAEQQATPDAEASAEEELPTAQAAPDADNAAAEEDTQA